MTISLINIGNVANDGTGDSLRQAFAKINENFEVLNVQSSEATTASNIGNTGESIFKQLQGTDLQFRKITGGENISISVVNDVITISSPDTLLNLNVSTDNGSTIISSDQTLSIQGGTLVSTSVVDDTLVINAESSLVLDTTPRLSNTLDAQNNDIINVKNITASGTAEIENLISSLEGTVYDIDVRILNKPYERLDFGPVKKNVTNWIDLLLFSFDVDFGTIATPSEITVDFGTF